MSSKIVIAMLEEDIAITRALLPVGWYPYKINISEDIEIKARRSKPGDRNLLEKKIKRLESLRGDSEPSSADADVVANRINMMFSDIERLFN